MLQRIIKMTRLSRFLSLASVIILLATIATSKTQDFALPANAVSDTDHEGGIVIVGISTRYDKQLGSFHLFGEVQNNLRGHAADHINLNATFYDSPENGNSVLGVLSGSSYFSFLNPGEKSGFELVAYGRLATMLENFSHYSVSASWDAIEKPKPGLLKLRVDRIFVDPCGSYHIEGAVTNYGRNDTGNIIVSSSFYNERGQVEASAYTRLADNREVLPSAATAPFVFIIEKSRLAHLNYYSLNVHSYDYSAFTDMNIDDNDLSLHAPRIAVYSDSSFYHVGTNTIRIFGTVRDSEPAQGVANPLVLLRILTQASTQAAYPLKIVTSPLSSNGSFSRTLDFSVPEGTDGQVYRIDASYEGTTAENTFAIDFTNNTEASSLQSASSEECSASVNLRDFGWTSNANNNPNNTNTSHSSNAELKKMNVGETVVFYAVAQNAFSRPQPITTIFEVLDSEGLVVFLHLDNHVMDSLADDAYQASVPWFPDSIGNYHVKIFIISGIEEPRIMSSTVVQELEVI
jgi:hypothetical protein